MPDQPGGYSLAPGAEWTDRAATWPVVVVPRETEPGHWLTDVVPADAGPPKVQLHLCCAECQGLPSVFCFIPDVEKAESYRFMWADVLAGILGHIRRSHET